MTAMRLLRHGAGCAEPDRVGCCLGYLQCEPHQDDADAARLRESLADVVTIAADPDEAAKGIARLLYGTGPDDEKYAAHAAIAGGN